MEQHRICNSIFATKNFQISKKTNLVVFLDRLSSWPTIIWGRMDDRTSLPRLELPISGLFPDCILRPDKRWRLCKTRSIIFCLPWTPGPGFDLVKILKPFCYLPVMNTFKTVKNDPISWSIIPGPFLCTNEIFLLLCDQESYLWSRQSLYREPRWSLYQKGAFPAEAYEHVNWPGSDRDR